MAKKKQGESDVGSNFKGFMKAIEEMPEKCSGCFKNITPTGSEKRFFVESERKAPFHSKKCFIRYVEQERGLLMERLGWLQTQLDEPLGLVPGKILDLSKCEHLKATETLGAHWSHPDLREGQLYLVKPKDGPWLLGEFHLLKPPYSTFWQFYPNLGCTHKQLSYGKKPQEYWEHIQEMVG